MRVKGDAAQAYREHRALSELTWRFGETLLVGRSKQGVRGFPDVDPALEAFARAAARGRLPGLSGRLLDVSATPALLPLWGEAAGLSASWTLAISSAATLRAAQATLAGRSLAASVEVVVALPWEVAGLFDGVLWRPPADRGRSRGLAELGALSALLTPTGVVVLLQHKDEGAERMLRDAAEYFREVEVIERHQGWRLATLRGVRTAVVAPSVSTEFETPLGRHSGVVGAFAAEKLDAGTALLLAFMLSEQGGLAGARVLDLGCGTGVLARAARIHGAAEVTAVDDDLAAVRATALNLGAPAAGQRLAVLHADLLDGLAGEVVGAFDQVWCNPPFHGGRAVVHPLSAAFGAAAWSALRPGGVATFVVNKALPYDQLLRHWRTFEDLTPPAERRYRLLRARR